MSAPSVVSSGLSLICVAAELSLVFEGSLSLLAFNFDKLNLALNIFKGLNWIEQISRYCGSFP